MHSLYYLTDPAPVEKEKLTSPARAPRFFIYFKKGVIPMQMPKIDIKSIKLIGGVISVLGFLLDAASGWTDGKLLEELVKEEVAKALSEKKGK